MEIIRPLLFLNPCSETLNRLHDALEPTAEKEGTEIFEIESVDEAGMMFRQLGQCLVMVSNAKKCVMLIKSYRKLIKKSGIKIILLSKTPINPMALAKLMKAGLTENIVDPVAPKTLLYKVRLQLKSIQPKKKEEPNEKKFNADNSDNEDDQAQTLNKKKTKKVDDLGGNLTGKVNKKKEEGDEEEKKTKSKYNTNEELGGHYKGQLAKEKEKEKEEALKKKNNALKIEEQEKARALKEEIEELENEMKKSNRKKIDINDDGSLEGTIGDQSDDFDDEIKKLKRSKKLDIENKNAKDNSIESEEDIKDKKKKKKHLNKSQEESYYEGQLKEKEEDEDEEQKKRNFKDEIENENTSGRSNYKEEDNDDLFKQKKLAKTANQKDESSRKKKLGLNIDDQTEESDSTQDNDNDEINNKRRKKLQLKEEADPLKRHSKEVEEEQTHNQRKKLKIDESLEELDYASMMKKKKNKQSKRGTLDIDDDRDSKRKKSDNQDDNGEDLYKRKSLKVDSDNADKKRASELEDEKNKKRKKGQTLSVDQQDKKRKKEEQEAARKKRKSNFKEEQAEGWGKNADAHAERIETHYSNKKSIDHTENDWSDDWKAEDNRLEKEKSDGGSLFYEKKKLGEQTIDYGKLKEEFDGYDFKKEHNVKDEENEKAEIKNEKKSHSSSDNNNILDLEKHIKNKSDQPTDEDDTLVEEEDQADQIYEPNTFGFHHVISILDKYEDEKSDLQSLADEISKVIFERYNAYCVFYSYSKTIKSYTSEFNSKISLNLPLSPIKRNESKMEKKELKIYKKELKEYQKNAKKEKEELESQWKEEYQESELNWQEEELPKWKDHRFIEKTQQFVYPVKEGLDKIGYISVVFDENIDEEESKIIEIILETSRGLFLEWSHKTMGNENNYISLKQEKKEEKKHPKKSKGFFGSIKSFFGKKKAA